MVEQVSHKTLWMLAILVVIFAAISTILIFSTVQADEISSNDFVGPSGPVMDTKIQVYVLPINDTVNEVKENG